MEDKEKLYDDEISPLMKQKPNGFIATCQCGEIVGALDYDLTDRKDAGKILGKWLSHGCTIQPKFNRWSVIISQCKCKETKK